MTDLLKQLEIKIDPDIKDCKGLIFRGYCSTFYDSNTQKIETKMGIRFLKKKSCKGCPKCGFYFDDIYDIIGNDNLVWPEEGIQQGSLYSIKVDITSTDWETGMADGWDFIIYKIKEGE